ncbi:uncharacterized protein LOC120421072 [Culex pipiens pallens]|uniref:uncharacterized protein LOC120421072 n=1 Tax=Culex pipiens pallens TaxID=42434 RepID=UPI0019541FFE|nr:uncharacterized protein LOC120421072 [Culex pipiens pallens]
MTPKGWIALVIVTLTMESTKSLNTADYIVSVIEHLAETDYGVPHCVFYGTSDKYPLNGTLEMVLQSTRLESVTKTVITDGTLSMQTFELPPDPTLIIMDGTVISKQTPPFLMKFKPSTRVIMLYPQAVRVAEYEMYLTYLAYYNVVHLDEFNQRTVVVDIVERAVLKQLPRPDRLFKHTFKRNMRGRPIRYCNIFTLPKRHIWVRWVKDTATFINTTIQEVLNTCTDGVLNLCYKEHLRKANVDVSLTEHISPQIIPNHFGILQTNVLLDRVLLAPRSPLQMVQLLTLPFSWHVWTALILLLISVEVIHLAVPKTFRNEPILMVVCGFERYDLHKADRIEKMALFSLIVLLFFMSRAYETRLLSMMVSRPATRDFNTVQDLVESGVMIRHDLQTGTAILDDHNLKSLVVNSTKNSVLDMDGVHAYMTERFLANLVLPKYYDPEQRMNRYHIMDESVGIAHVGFFLRVRSPLVDVLGHTMTVLLESGIHGHLSVASATFKIEKDIAGYQRLSTGDDSLYFEDLFPAWMTLLVGLAVGLAGFVGEIAVCKACHYIDSLQRDSPVAAQQ